LNPEDNANGGLTGKIDRGEYGEDDDSKEEDNEEESNSRDSLDKGDEQSNGDR
jgi:hypothetical protein